MPKSAIRIGRPIASREPNATSRITMAARMPISSAGPEAAELLEHAATERDVHAAAFGGVGERADPFDGGVGDLRRDPVELHGRVRDVAVAGDLLGAVGAVGADDRSYAGHRGDVTEERFHPRLHRGVLHAARVREHDLALVTRPGGEPRLQEVGRALRLGARQRETLRERRAHARPDGADGDQRHDPQDEHAPASSVAPRGQPLQHPRRRRVSIVCGHGLCAHNPANLHHDARVKPTSCAGRRVRTRWAAGTDGLGPSHVAIRRSIWSSMWSRSAGIVAYAERNSRTLMTSSVTAVQATIVTGLGDGTNDPDLAEVLSRLEEGDLVPVAGHQCRALDHDPELQASVPLPSQDLARRHRDGGPEPLEAAELLLREVRERR